MGGLRRDQIQALVPCQRSEANRAWSVIQAPHPIVTLRQDHGKICSDPLCSDPLVNHLSINYRYQ